MNDSTTENILELNQETLRVVHQIRDDMKQMSANFKTTKEDLSRGEANIRADVAAVRDEMRAGFSQLKGSIGIVMKDVAMHDAEVLEIKRRLAAIEAELGIRPDGDQPN